jgi:hypothetical protein
MESHSDLTCCFAIQLFIIHDFRLLVQKLWPAVYFFNQADHVSEIILV